MKRILLFSLLLVLAASVPMGNARAQAQVAGPIYIVQSGDYLSSIAGQFGVGLQALLEANGLDSTTVIQPGERLIIPGLDGITGVISTQIVALGETLPVLALQTGLSQDAIIRLNHLVNLDRVFAGEELVITKQEQPTPASLTWGYGRAVSLTVGAPLLAVAAAEGRNPWEILAQNGLPSMADTVPGQSILLASTTGDIPLRAWTDPLHAIVFRDFPLTQGSTSEISIMAEGVSSAEGLLGKSPLRFQPSTNGLVALQGIDVDAVPATLPFQIRVTLAGGHESSFQQDVLMKAGDFRTLHEQLVVPEETVDQKAVDAENAVMAELVAPVTPERYWSGAFTPPSSRGISSYFGDHRIYNGGALSSTHHGVDYFGIPTDGIMVPAAGKVVFTGPMVVCGNATVVDHGWGVYSRFCHQSKFEVGVGEVVVQGQEIGKVGTTGRANGPHLHWELWVNGVNVEPLTWLQTAFP
jgi:murein DD-endopeptidase MepM/ murein hydrolase activator NlpD